MGKGKGCAASGGTVVIAEDPAALLTRALAEHLAETNKNKLPYATEQDGFESVVIAAKANEAINSGTRVEWNESEYSL